MQIHFRMALLTLCALTLIIYLLQQHLCESQRTVQIRSSTDLSKLNRNTLHIAVVACGQRLQETLVMIKSALLFNHYQEKLRFLIFTEDNLKQGFEEKLNDWKQLFLNTFDFELLSLQFPVQSETEWKTLFKPCAAQRLFLPSLLDVDSLLYVDTDIIFLSPISDIWHFFGEFNGTQISALTPEHEDENIGWYNRFARHPYYGHLGVNSGVMLMNLTRMRAFGWEKHIYPIHKEYKLRITWGDQDIINILFYYHPEKLYIMPCEYNYRPDHCMYMNICNTSNNGIKLIHGNRGYFHSEKQPLFRAIYDAMESYKLGSDAHRNFLLPLKNNLEDESKINSGCGKVYNQALKLAVDLFGDNYNSYS